ncbi:hypothetical protein ACFVHI_02160 [Kitasatospora sp. NPDC127121]|uniref:hypothetical protein n=1 Tax=Kitasatospora sp. NPDC127121 TaxID=3345371 RepID=UPI003640548C
MASLAAVSEMVVIKTDGTQTTPMRQPQAESYLVNVLNEAGMGNRLANLKQSLNQAFNGQGKPTGSYQFRGKPVLHASSGNGQQSVTLFFYADGSKLMLFAMGEHVSSTQYRISIYGQQGDPNFAKGKVISI